MEPTQNTQKIIIGTRGSKLALWQAHFTADILQQAGYPTELKIIKTQGDKIQHLSFDKLEGKGFFTKELEDALLSGEIDLAVHSMKDLPTNQPDGLVIAAVSYRDNPADWLIIRPDALDTTQPFQLKLHARVGSSSARRKAQIKHFRPDVEIAELRGNVPTRIEKLASGQYDAILLAAAGLSRLQLDLSTFTVLALNPKEFIPAPAQGVLAYQTCEHNTHLRRILQTIHHPQVSRLTNIERRVLQLMEGGCHLPLGVYCESDRNNNLHVWAALAQHSNAPVHYVHLSSVTTYQLAEQVVAALKNNNL